MNYKEKIKCPKCLKANDVEELEENTEYSCWSSEETGVYCTHCEQYFQVSCEHQGYQPKYGDFDMQSFMKIHGIKVPYDEGCSYTWVTHYLKDLVEDGTTKVYVPEPPYQSQTDDCRKSYEFAMKEWNRIQASLVGKEDNELR